MKKFASILLMFLLCTSATKKLKTVQIDISAILNARPVTILHNGKLITWSKGIDGGGKGDGYLTMQAALFNGDKQANALPDNPVFPANSFHPEIALHFCNNDTSSAQAACIAGEGSIEFAVPKHTYNNMYLCLTSAEGASQLQIELQYTDGTETKSFLLPDYYTDLAANDYYIGYLAHDLAKWDANNKMRETNHHNIDVINMPADAARVLTGIKITKAKQGYLVFWAAAGIVAK